MRRATYFVTIKRVDGGIVSPLWIDVDAFKCDNSTELKDAIKKAIVKEVGVKYYDFEIVDINLINWD